MILFFVNIGVLLLLAALCPRPQLGRYRIDAQKLYVVLAMGYLMLLAIEEEDYYFLPGEGIDESMSWGKTKQIVNKYLEHDLKRPID